MQSLRHFFGLQSHWLIIVALTLALEHYGLAAPPTVSNIRANQRAGTHLVDIYYNVSDPDSSVVSVFIAVSADGGTNYNLPVYTLSGAYGAGVAIGIDRHIVWDAGVDWGGQFSIKCKVRITADDGSGPPAPAGMVLIPFGPFQMGDSFFEGAVNELPLHSVQLSAFFMDRYEVNRELWLDVYTWAIGNGYGFSSGSYGGSNYPLHSIFWYDAVKWCNARSQKAGLTPVYYTDASQTTVYRTNTLNLTNACVNWSATGYRLPTEAEWEKAARGGVAGFRYPWGQTISNTNAAYNAIPTRPVGTYAPNGYGLYDMSGNVAEWCWDWFQGTWYGQVGATSPDTRGPNIEMTHRILRGGSSAHGPSSLRCSDRDSYSLPGTSLYYIGFRCVRGL